MCQTNGYPQSKDENTLLLRNECFLTKGYQILWHKYNLCLDFDLKFQKNTFS